MIQNVPRFSDEAQVFYRIDGNSKKTEQISVRIHGLSDCKTRGQARRKKNSKGSYILRQEKGPKAKIVRVVVRDYKTDTLLI